MCYEIMNEYESHFGSIFTHSVNKVYTNAYNILKWPCMKVIMLLDTLEKEYEDEYANHDNHVVRSYIADRIKLIHIFMEFLESDMK